MSLVRKAATILSIGLVIVLAYPLKSGKGLRDATEDQITQQVPYALDILAARYPIKVGLIRAALNENGAVDRFAQNYMRSVMDDQKISIVECYVIYYTVAFNADGVRKAIADNLEKQFSL